MRFEKKTLIEAPAREVFAFHERPDALARLVPPWEPVEIVIPPRSLDVGTRVVLRVKVGPFSRRLVAEHVAYVPGAMFEDHLIESPFRSFRHQHIVEGDGPHRAWLIDRIDYELPLGALGRWFGDPIVRSRLTRMFEHRHAVTKAACESRPAANGG
jgi:ligand-binding SRPBCC domain-containing protein